LRSVQTNSSGVPISKITRTKWTGGVVQAVECLLCKHEVLNSNPSPTHPGPPPTPTKKRKKSLKKNLVTNVIWSVQEREKWNPISSKKKKKIPTEYPLMQKTYFAFKRDKAASKDTRPSNHA
jgi:hypothetical protein